MALQTSRIFSLLLVICLGVVLFILSGANLSVDIRWAALSGKYTQKGEDGQSEGGSADGDHEGNTTTSPPVFNTTRAHSVTTITATKNVSTSRRVDETPMPVLFRKSYKKLPVWDFDDEYHQDAAPRQTTCAQSLRNSEDESFRKAFLPNIRLFLHKDNMNMRDWNRLSHFNNPFGFMDFKYDDVMASVKMIPKPEEPLLSPKPGGDGCVRCAVVGTAGILNGSKMGKEIDAHDYVFRMNGAAIKGYEEDVGNRTSVYVHTAHSITSSLYVLKKYGYTSVPNDEGIKYVMIPEGMRDFQWLEGLLKGDRVSAGPYRNRRFYEEGTYKLVSIHKITRSFVALTSNLNTSPSRTKPSTYYGGQYNASRFYVLHQDFLRYVRNRFLKSHNLNAGYWAIVRPTNGAFTIFLALQTCDVVHAYGFMTDDYQKYSNYYVERHTKTHVVFYANHDYILELNLWKRLHNSKILSLYQRKDTTTEKPKQ